MSTRTRLPNPPANLDPEVLRWSHDLVRQIENITTRDYRAKARNWSTTNTPSTGRSVDANSATADEVRKALALLISDLKNAGVLA